MTNNILLYTLKIGTRSNLIQVYRYVKKLIKVLTRLFITPNDFWIRRVFLDSCQVFFGHGYVISGGNPSRFLNVVDIFE